MPHLVSGINSLPLLQQPCDNLSISDSDLPKPATSAKLTILIIHNSFSLSLRTLNLPLSQILPTIDPLGVSQLITRSTHQSLKSCDEVTV